MTDIREQITTTRARAEHISQLSDPTDAEMHKANAFTMERLLAEHEAAGEYLYDTNKRQGLQDAYLAVQTTEQNDGR